MFFIEGVIAQQNQINSSLGVRNYFFLPLVGTTTCINQEASFCKRSVTCRREEINYNMLIPNLTTRLAEERQRNNKQMILTSSKENFCHYDFIGIVPVNKT